jgi:hypothetical protein
MPIGRFYLVTQVALADDLDCSVGGGCISAILANAARASYGYSPEQNGRGETAELMWCQLAVTVYSWRRPGVDPEMVEFGSPHGAVREHDQYGPNNWQTTAASLSLCAGKLKIVDGEKLAKAKDAAAQWAKKIVLLPESPESPDELILPPK